MDLEIPVSEMLGGGGDFWKRTKKKHVLRFFAFLHDGRFVLAVRRVLHFVSGQPADCEGPGCALCKEAADSNDRRLRATEKFSMVIKDMDSEEEVLQVYDVPVSVYNKLKANIDEAEKPEDIIGNEGVDFVLTYDGDALPANQYALTPKIKGSVVLDFEDDVIPDLLDKSGLSSNDQGQDAGEEVEGDPCTFKDSRGREITGRITGKQRNGKEVVEAEGRLWHVAQDIKATWGTVHRLCPMLTLFITGV